LIPCSLLLPNLGVIVLVRMVFHCYRRRTSSTGIRYRQLSVSCLAPRMPKRFNRNKNNSFFILVKKERKVWSNFPQELNKYPSVLLCFSKIMKDKIFGIQKQLLAVLLCFLPKRAQALVFMFNSE